MGSQRVRHDWVTFTFTLCIFTEIYSHHHYLIAEYLRAKLLQSSPTVCNPNDCRPPGSSVHSILQARILEWVAISSSRDLPNSEMQPKSLTSPALAGGFFTTEQPGKPLRIFDHPQKETSDPLSPSPQSLATSNLCPMHLPLWGIFISEITQYTVFCFCLPSLSMFSRITHCSLYQYFIPFYCQIISHCMNIPRFVYSFISWRARQLFAFFLLLW